MRRSSAKILSLIFLAVLLLALAACGGGGGSSSSGPTRIALSPATAAVQQGGFFQITATPEDSNGNALGSFTPTYSVTSNGNLVSVSVNGLVCAGHWDSLTTPVNCTPATGSGKATVIASVNSVSSTPLVIDVVPLVDNLTISADDVAQDPSGLDCVSQTDPNPTRGYTAKASYKGQNVDLKAAGVTDAITWNMSATSVGTLSVTPNSTTGVLDSTHAVVTAKIPGRGQLSASFFNTGSPWLQSTPASFTTCPVSSITIADSTGAVARPSPLSPTGTVTLTPTIKDSKGSTVNLTDSSGTTILSLLWSSSKQSVATAASTGVVTANSSTGVSSVIASCTPPNCNIGLGGVYSNVYTTQVTGTTTSRTVYVGSGTATAGLSLFPINTNGNAVGTAITLGDLPNSMLFDGTGTNLYIGTNSGLIVLATATNAVTSPITTMPGKVLAISPDSTTLLISNSSIVSDQSKSQVFVYSISGATTTTLNIHGATAAAFSPDSSTAYIVGNNTWTVYSGGTASASTTITGAQSTTFLASGALGYIAASPLPAPLVGSGLGSKGTCNGVDEGTITTSGTPTLVGALPDGQNLLSVAAPNLDLVKVTSSNAGFVNAAHGCAPVPATTIPASFALNAGAAFTAKQLIVTPDGSRAYVLSNIGSLLGTSIAGTALTDASIPLSGGAVPSNGGATIDSTTIFVGSGDTNVHRVDLTTNTDTPISITSAPAGFTSDFVAVQPI